MPAVMSIYRCQLCLLGYFFFWLGNFDLLLCFICFPFFIQTPSFQRRVLPPSYQYSTVH